MSVVRRHRQQAAEEVVSTLMKPMANNAKHLAWNQLTLGYLCLKL